MIGERPFGCSCTPNELTTGDFSPMCPAHFPQLDVDRIYAKMRDAGWKYDPATNTVRNDEAWGIRVTADRTDTIADLWTKAVLGCIDVASGV